jgi:hypothetical protein
MDGRGETNENREAQIRILAIRRSRGRQKLGLEAGKSPRLSSKVIAALIGASS